jgi:hypothetical protein
MDEIPALYEVAKKVCHDAGLPYTDPRSGVTYPPPNKLKAKKRKGTHGNGQNSSKR